MCVFFAAENFDLYFLSLRFFFNPKNPWRGLNLYSRVLGPQNSHFRGLRILRVDV